VAKQFTDEDDALLTALEVEVVEKKTVKRTAREERIIAGFEEIQRFVDEHGRVPQHGEERDIFERLYSVRLDRIKRLEECRALVIEMDYQDLLSDEIRSFPDVDDLDDDALLRELGVEDEISAITELRHVRSIADRKAAEEIANRVKCEGFDTFEPLFIEIKANLDDGSRHTIRFRKDAGFAKTDLKQGQFIILGGQTAYIAEMGETIKAPNGEDDARLRVIYSNGTESDLLLRSLIRAMYKDETSRLISDVSAGPLFSDVIEDGDLESGTVYVLRSNSDNPAIKNQRDLLHKIGVTGGSVEKRVANASKDPTFLLADVEIVASYQLLNISRSKFENLIHRVFDKARLDIDITDRFGHPVEPREWFLVPIFVIDDAIEKFKDGTIEQYVYDPDTASLTHIS